MTARPESTVATQVPGASATGGPTAEAKPGRPIVVRPALGEGEHRETRKEKREKPKVYRPAEAAPAPEVAAIPPSSPASGGATSSQSPAVEGAAGASAASRMPAESGAPAPTGTPPPTGGAPRMATGRPAVAGIPPGARDTARTDTARSITELDRTFKPVIERNPPTLGVGAKPPVPPQTVTPAPPSAATTPRPVPAGRSPAIIAPGGATAAPSAAACDCEIRGTVEVQSDHPLSSRTEVVISMDDDPAIRASVELFMGSPRAFEIHGAPCGAHHLTLHTRSKQRFVLSSAEPRVMCVDRGTEQIRLVLEPVARWGVTP